MPVTIGATVQGVTAIASTVANIKDQAKRTQFQQELSLLSNSQQNDLNNKLLAANSDTERLQILSDAVLQFTIASESTQQKTQSTMLIIAGVLGAVLLAVALVYALKKK
jgi:hypothetical protein